MISFIIPFYNASLYLERCVKSITEQGFAEYEIVLVDDGSQDESASISDKLALEYPQISVLHQKNGGVSSARNKGIDVAKGEWIWFVDADDYLLPEAISVEKIAEQRVYDSIAFSYIQEISKNKSYPILATLEIKEKSCSGKKLINTKNCAPTCWAFLFRTDILRKYKIRMSEELKFGEDKIFVLQYLLHVKNIYFIKTPVYFYAFCESSAVHRNYMKNIKEIDDQLNSVILLLMSLGKKDYMYFRPQVFYLVTQYILLSSTAKLGTLNCWNKYLSFIKKCFSLGYRSVLLNLTICLLPVFYYKPYLPKRRFMMWYFSYNRKKLGL